MKAITYAALMTLAVFTGGMAHGAEAQPAKDPEARMKVLAERWKAFLGKYESWRYCAADSSLANQELRQTKKIPERWLLPWRWLAEMKDIEVEHPGLMFKNGLTLTDVGVLRLTTPKDRPPRLEITGTGNTQLRWVHFGEDSDDCKIRQELYKAPDRYDPN